MDAPLAQLVEHLTLNQGVQGSSPWRCTQNTVFGDAGALGMVFFFVSLDPSTTTRRGIACRKAAAALNAPGRSLSSPVYSLVFQIKYGLNEPNGYVPILFVHRQQIVCQTDHTSGSNPNLQRVQPSESRFPGNGFQYLEVFNGGLAR